MGFFMDSKSFATLFGEQDTADARPSSEFDRIIIRLGDYLREQKQPEEQELGRWIGDGKSLCGSLVRQDALKNIVTEMCTSHMPFAVATEGRGTGYSGILMRSCDRENYNRLRDTVLERMGSLVYTAPGSVLKTFVMAQESDKEIVTIDGLSREDVRAFVEKSREMSCDTVVGVDRLADGTYRVSFHAESFAKPDKGSRITDANQLLLETILSQHGANKGKMEKQKRDGQMYENELSSLFSAASYERPAWIVGDGALYVKVTDKSFELGESRITDAGVLELERIEDPYPREKRDFIYQLNTALGQIGAPMVTYDANLAKDHLLGNRPLAQPLSDIERHAEAGELALAAKVSEIIGMHAAASGRSIASGENYGRNLKNFCRDAAKIIQAAMGDGEMPYGYHEGEIEGVRAVCRTFHLKPENYKAACRMLEQIEPGMYTAQPDLVDVNAALRLDEQGRQERVRRIQKQEMAIESGRTGVKERDKREQLVDSQVGSGEKVEWRDKEGNPLSGIDYSGYNKSINRSATPMERDDTK